jgi:hypothetical protein
MFSYQRDKHLRPELGFWYSKVEHYQRELAAYGAALAGIAAAQRLLVRPQTGTPQGQGRARVPGR